MDSKKSNKIREIVKKWKKQANASNNAAATSSTSRSIKFLKRTLSFADVSSSPTSLCSPSPPKGFLAVSVGEEQKRFLIPTEYLSHEAFMVLLRKAEEEFGFQQEGVLRIPCEVSVFKKILKMIEVKKDTMFLHDFGFSTLDAQIIASCCSPDAQIIASCCSPDAQIIASCCSPDAQIIASCCSPDAELTPSHHPQTCR